MSEAGDYEPGDWKGHDFASARQDYDRYAKRSYADAQNSKKDATKLVPQSMNTNSSAPLVIACDVTGSMGEWPATIFSKLPYLDLEGKQYLGPDMEISFAAIGDAYSDQYPLQVRPFTSGTDLATHLKELVIEGNGGGQARESYDLPALYFSRQVEMPGAINKPIFIYIGDEGIYDFVDKDQAKKWANTTLEGRLSSRQVMEELKDKFSVYIVRKNFGSGSGDSRNDADQAIQRQWETYLGADHVVDVIFGILAQETGRIDYFRDEIKGRQRPDQVTEALKSLKSIHTGLPGAPLLPSGKSVMRLPGGNKTKPIL